MRLREIQLRIADPVRADARAKEIQEAALRCFVRTGFRASSMRDIAGEAGVSLGLLYRYFDNKAAIIGIAIDTDSGEFVGNLERLKQDQLTETSLLDFLEQETLRRGEPSEFALASEVVAESARDPAIQAMVRRNMVVAETALAEVLLDLGGASLLVEAKRIAMQQARQLLGLIDSLSARRFFGLEADIRQALLSALRARAT